MLLVSSTILPTMLERINPLEGDQNSNSGENFPLQELDIHFKLFNCVLTLYQVMEFQATKFWIFANLNHSVKLYQNHFYLLQVAS